MDSRKGFHKACDARPSGIASAGREIYAPVHSLCFDEGRTRAMRKQAARHKRLAADAVGCLSGSAIGSLLLGLPQYELCH